MAVMLCQSTPRPGACARGAPCAPRVPRAPLQRCTSRTPAACRPERRTAASAGGPNNVTTGAGDGGGLFGGFQRIFNEVFMYKGINAPGDLERPPHMLVKATKYYDLRLYNVFPVVEMDYTRREEGYVALSAYMDGDNDQGRKFNSTQPVMLRYEHDGRKVMQFFLASRRGDEAQSNFKRMFEPLDELPRPVVPDIRLSIAGGELVALLRFEGMITPERARTALNSLRQALERDGVQLADAEAQGLFRIAQYGPVYTIEKRMAEVMLAVKSS